MSCERVEDCQRECGEEKRFTCEGFNYKLDPSGHGQGICELIEVPLHEMDVYSSARNRDSNLLRHPDYDYYERDRNAAPGCHQPIGCVDCTYLKPYRPYRPSTSDHYKPYPETTSDHYKPYPDARPQYEHDRFHPQITAVDKYRPSLTDNRPSSGGNGYNGYDNQYLNYYESGNKYKPLPVELDRYDPNRPADLRPGSGYGEITVPSPFPQRPADYHRPDDYRPPYKPYPDYIPNNRPNHQSSHNYLDRDPPNHTNKPTSFVPYTIGPDSSYSSGYGGSSYSQKGSPDFWGVRGNDLKRVDGGSSQFNYFDLGKTRYAENSVWKNSGNQQQGPPNDDQRKFNYGTIWTRRPGVDGKFYILILNLYFNVIDFYFLFVLIKKIVL